MVNISRLTVAYLNATINVKPQTQNRRLEPEIGTDGSSQTRRNLRVDGYGSGFGPPWVCGSGFWTVLQPNRPVFAVHTRTAGGLPGPVSNTKRTYWLREFTCERLQNVKYINYQPLLTTQDEWTIVKYVMEGLWPFRYWTLWMSKRHTVTLHYIITVYNDMFDQMDGVSELLLRRRHNQRKTSTPPLMLRARSCSNIMLKSLQRPVSFWFQHICLNLSGSCTHSGSGTRR